MKKMAGFHFENLLLVCTLTTLPLVCSRKTQCAPAAFEGLLPAPFNAIVLDLLWDLNLWYGTAALRIHTDETRVLLTKSRKSLGRSMRKFRDECANEFATRPLPKELAARDRRRMRAALKKAASKPAPPPAARGRGRPKRKGTAPPKGKGKAPVRNDGWEDEEDVTKDFHLNYPKYHAIPYYEFDICRFGGLDAVSTTPVRASSTR
jgi:hypothetical protein